MSFGIPVRNGLGVGLLASTSLSTRGGSFSPASLFLAGEPGAWYDPSDFTTLYRDPAGTTPVTAVGQTVGLMLDKSKGLVLGPELVTNGTFDSSANWALGTGFSISGGQLVLAGVTAGSISNSPETPAVVGKTYLLTLTIANISGGAIRAEIGGNSNGVTYTAPGTYVRRVVANDARGSRILWNNGTVNAAIDEFSVRELPGNHASQSVLASRPILAREPLGGRRNLLTYTEQFDNAAWVKNNSTVTANAAVAPDGTTTADALVWASATNPQLTRAAVAITAGTPVTLTTYAKAGTKSSITLILFNDGSNFALASFNLTNGTAGTPSVAGTRFLSLSASAVNIGDGWYRCTLSASTNTLTSVEAWLRADTATGSGDNIHIWGAQLETGSTATAYQRVTSTYDVTEAGKADLHYLLFDGSDDFLATPTITPGADKAQVFAGVRKLSDAARGAVVDFGAAGNGFFNIEAPSSASNPDYTFRSTGTLAVNTSFANYPAPITNIVTGLGDISGDRATLRVNGAQVGQSTGDQGTGNYLAYPAYIGRRGGTLLPFNGRIYSLIVRFGANLTAAQIAQTEAWVNSRTGAY